MTLFNLESIIDKILTETSGKRAWDNVSRLSVHHRIQASPMYDEAARIIFKELEILGIEVKLLNFPANGTSASWEWYPPYSWEIKSGNLWIVEPEREQLACFDELPMSVVTHSEKCDITAEIIDVGKGETPEDYKEKDVTGKIVLLSGSPRKCFDIAVDAGAVGLIIYPDEKKSSGHPSLVRYDGMWPDKDNRDKLTSGFSISRDQYLKLKSKMTGETVKVHAQIDARLYSGQMTVISAAIKGTKLPGEEIILIAHLCHPAASANDNASGSAGLLEAARVMQELIKKGRLEPPERTVRFLWVPEFSGTAPWIEKNEETVKKAVACINLDMIGEDPVKIGYPFQASGAPYSTPSVINDIIRRITPVIADHPKGVAVNGTKMAMRYRFSPFMGGSDHILFADAWTGIPGLMLGHEDMFHHSSLDTTDVCDPTEMQRVISIALSTAYCLAVLNGNNLENIWSALNSGIYRRLGTCIELLGVLREEMRDHGKRSEEVITLDEKAAFGEALIESAVFHEKKVLRSAKKFGSLSDAVKLLYELIEKELGGWKENQNSLWRTSRDSLMEGTDDEKLLQVQSKTYRRNYEGPTPYSYFKRLEKEKIFTLLSGRVSEWNLGGIILEILNLAGNGHDIREISSLISLQYGCLNYPSEIHDFMEMLVEKEIQKTVD